VVYSPERQQHERKLRETQQEKVRQRLERLAERVAAGEFTRQALLYPGLIRQANPSLFLQWKGGFFK